MYDSWSLTLSIRASRFQILWEPIFGFRDRRTWEPIGTHFCIETRTIQYQTTDYSRLLKLCLNTSVCLDLWRKGTFNSDHLWNDPKWPLDDLWLQSLTITDNPWSIHQGVQLTFKFSAQVFIPRARHFYHCLVTVLYMAKFNKTRTVKSRPNVRNSVKQCHPIHKIRLSLHNTHLENKCNIYCHLKQKLFKDFNEPFSHINLCRTRVF